MPFVDFYWHSAEKNLQKQLCKRVHLLLNDSPIWFTLLSRSLPYPLFPVFFSFLFLICFSLVIFVHKSCTVDVILDDLKISSMTRCLKSERSCRATAVFSSHVVLPVSTFSLFNIIFTFMTVILNRYWNVYRELLKGGFNFAIVKTALDTCSYFLDSFMNPPEVNNPMYWAGCCCMLVCIPAVWVSIC